MSAPSCGSPTKPAPQRAGTGTRSSKLLDRKTCIPCTKAKRRCDKGTPTCHRCTERAIDCQYPATRPYVRAAKWSVAAQSPSLRLAIESHLPLSDISSPFLSSAQTPYMLQQFDDNDEDAQIADLDLGNPSSCLTVRSTDGSCFLGSSTWKIEHWNVGPQPCSIHISIVKRWADEIQEWLRQWVSDGANPFIHKQLYDPMGLSQCLQDAWSTLAVYFSKTRENENIIMDIVQTRAHHLLVQQNWEDDSLMAVPSLMETIDHLARVQALFIYQFIRLFDGDIRQRALAEKDIPTMSSWCQQLWQSAYLDAECGAWIPGQHVTGDDGANHGDPMHQIWRAWIKSESVRRTLIVANCTQGIFLTLRDGYVACPGGVMFTARQGLWDARSSSAWDQVQQNRDTILVTSSKAEQLFFANNPGDVDTFSTLILKIIWTMRNMSHES